MKKRKKRTKIHRTKVHDYPLARGSKTISLIVMQDQFQHRRDWELYKRFVQMHRVTKESMSAEALWGEEGERGTGKSSSLFSTHMIDAYIPPLSSVKTCPSTCLRR